MPPNDDRAQLQRARKFIIEQRFAEARVILRGIDHNATARQWLAKLDEIDPAEANPAPPPRPASPPPFSGGLPAPQTVSIHLTAASIRSLVGGIVAVMGLLMVVGFFLFAWLDMTQISFFGLNLSALAGEADVDEGPMKITAMEIWMGRNNGEDFTLSMTDPATGFDGVRSLDRLLIAIPVGALVLVWLAWMYATNALPPLAALGTMSLLALILLVFPLAWQELSERDWNSAFDDMLAASGGLESEFDSDYDTDFELDLGPFSGMMFTGFMKEMVSTGEQQLLGGIALVACLLGLAVEFMSAAPTPGPCPIRS